MNTLAIICAKYLWILPILIGALYLWKNRDNWKPAVTFGAFVLPISYIVAKILGHFFYNARPFVVENFQPLIAHADDNGFPSDHTLIAAAIAATVTFFDKKWAIWLWIITLLVAWGRVFTGVHHTMDVAGSIVISLVVAQVVYLFGKK